MLDRFEERFKVSSDRCQTLLFALIMDGMLIQPPTVYLDGLSRRL